MEKLVLVSIKNRVAYITLNRPQKRNALNPQLISELIEVFKEAETNHEVKVLVLKSSGDVFSAGADLSYLQQLQTNTYQENLDDSQKLKDLFFIIYNLEKLVIGQVEGNAIAGGCGLVSVCDIVFSVPTALFGYTEVKLGFVPALVSAFLLRRIGEGRTKELLLSGALIDAETAFGYGLINFIREKEMINEAVRAYAENLTENTSAEAIKTTKAMLSKIQSLSLDEALDYATKTNAAARLTENCKKGIDAFVNKKLLRW